MSIILRLDEKLLILRKRLKDQGVDIATPCGVSQQTISNWCVGRSAPSAAKQPILTELSSGWITPEDFTPMAPSTAAPSNPDAPRRLTKKKRGAAAAETAVAGIPAPVVPTAQCIEVDWFLGAMPAQEGKESEPTPFNFF